MKKFIQVLLLTAYRFLKASGILSTDWGRDASERAYFIYKRFFEQSFTHLRSLVQPGATVIDVGANIGFFTVIFSKWAIDGGHVIAIEPESRNCEALKRSIARSKSSNVEIIEAAAADKDGYLFLSLNPANPADHRLADAGIPIVAITIDGLMRSRGWPAVSLIKMDIQGAEPRALLGARETIRRFHPAIFIEIDDQALQAAGFSANELIDSLSSLGYSMYGSKKGELQTPINVNDALIKRENLGYADFVFMHEKTINTKKNLV